MWGGAALALRLSSVYEDSVFRTKGDLIAALGEGE